MRWPPKALGPVLGQLCQPIVDDSDLFVAVRNAAHQSFGIGIVHVFGLHTHLVGVLTPIGRSISRRRGHCYGPTLPSVRLWRNVSAYELPATSHARMSRPHGRAISGTSHGQLRSFYGATKTVPFLHGRAANRTYCEMIGFETSEPTREDLCGKTHAEDPIRSRHAHSTWRARAFYLAITGETLAASWSAMALRDVTAFLRT